jgi:hypothetical protein
VDKKHWADMYAYLKALGVKQLITGTQLEYGSVSAQAKMDFCDAHSYWDHPVFPNFGWDLSDWFMHNQPIIMQLEASPLMNLATKRVAGKPFTVSEYGHTWINAYSAEGGVLSSIIAAFQGWDGIYPFDWDNTGEYKENQPLFNFFNIRDNPVQMAHQIACNNLITRDYVKQDKLLLLPLNEEKELELFKKYQNAYNFGFNGLGYDLRLALINQTGIDLSGDAPLPQTKAIDSNLKKYQRVLGDDFIFYIKTDIDKPYLSAKMGNTSILTGFFKTNESYPFGKYSIRFDDLQIDWATVSMTLIEEDEFVETHLLAITGAMKNTEMQLQSIFDDKITLNNQGINTYGKSPILCETIPCQLLLGNTQDMVVYPLDNRGERMCGEDGEPIKLTADKVGLLLLQPTIWYEVEIYKKTE